MSLGIIIKAPEGLVLAAESRVTLTTQKATPAGTETMHVNFDNATKLLTFNGSHTHIGGVTYGAATIGVRTPHSFLPEFESNLNLDKKLTVEHFAIKLSDFFMLQWKDGGMPDAASYTGQNMIFNIAGYDDKEPYGKIFTFEIPKMPKPTEVNAGKDNFGIAWGGQRQIVDRLMMGYDQDIFNILVANKMIDPANIENIKVLFRPLQLQTPFQFMPLQDCINLAILFIKTTITAQSLTVGLRGCGGAIDVAIITRNQPLSFIQKKNYVAEQ